MIKRLAGLVAGLTAAAALASCGGGDDNGGGGGDQVSADTANAKGNVTWCIGKDTSGAFQQVVKAHNKANPDVKAKLIELPTSADEQRTQLIQRLRAKSSECDVLGMDVIWTAEFAAQKWLKDVGPIVDKRKGEFIPSTLETAKYQDSYWAIPFNTNAGFLYYRTDKIKSAPKTWQEVDQAAKSGGGLVYQGAQYEGLTVNFLERLYSAGGKVLSDDGKSSELTSPEAEKVLTEMVQEVKDGTVPKANATYMEEESRRAFESGKPAAMRNWPYAYALGKKSDIADKFAVAPLPAFEGGEPAGVIGGYNLGISAFTKNEAAAVEFTNYITNKDSQLLFGTKSGLPPVLTAVYDDPAMKKAAPYATELRTAVEQAQPRPVSPVWNQMNEAINKNVYAALQGNQDPKAALEKASSAVDKALQTF